MTFRPDEINDYFLQDFMKLCEDKISYFSMCKINTVKARKDIRSIRIACNQALRKLKKIEEGLKVERYKEKARIEAIKASQKKQKAKEEK